MMRAWPDKKTRSDNIIKILSGISQTKQKSQGVAGAVELEVGVVVKTDGLFEGIFWLPLLSTGIEDPQT